MGDKFEVKFPEFSTIIGAATAAVAANVEKDFKGVPDSSNKKKEAAIDGLEKAINELYHYIDDHHHNFPPYIDAVVDYATPNISEAIEFAKQQLDNFIMLFNGMRIFDRGVDSVSSEDG